MKPKCLMNGHTDEIYSPPEALNTLLPFIKTEWIILEAAYGEGHLANNLFDCGYNVIGYKSFDFLKSNVIDGYDIIVTNPPYSLKTKFIKKCYDIGKPFALLLPLTALEGKERGALYDKYGIELLIPNKRINFITPKYKDGKNSSSWFQTAWFCWKLNLPQQLNFIKV